MIPVTARKIIVNTILAVFLALCMTGCLVHIHIQVHRDHHVQPAHQRPRPSAAWDGGYRLGSDRGSPNQGSTLASNRVIAQIRSSARVSTYRPVPWRVPPGPCT
jgi:hypothetical protein